MKGSMLINWGTFEILKEDKSWSVPEWGFGVREGIQLKPEVPFVIYKLKREVMEYESAIYSLFAVRI